DPALPELLLDVRVPEVLHLVVRPPRQLRSNLRPPVSFVRAKRTELHPQLDGSFIIIIAHGLKKKLAGPEICCMDGLPLWHHLLVAHHGMEMDDQVLRLLRERSPLEGRPEVVDPPPPAALPTPR